MYENITKQKIEHFYSIRNQLAIFEKTCDKIYQ